jgi:hypothetical protein
VRTDTNVRQTYAKYLIAQLEKLGFQVQGLLLASFWLTLYGEVMSYGLGYFFATAALAIAGAVVGLRGALEFVKLVIEELELRKMRE